MLGGSNLFGVVTLPCSPPACLTHLLFLMQHNIHLPGAGSERGGQWAPTQPVFPSFNAPHYT